MYNIRCSGRLMGTGIVCLGVSALGVSAWERLPREKATKVCLWGLSTQGEGVYQKGVFT